MEETQPCSDCEATKRMIQEWMDQQGHERCWYYPDLFMKLVALFGLAPKRAPLLPPRTEFEKGCSRYQREEYGDSIR